MSRNRKRRNRQWKKPKQVGEWPPTPKQLYAQGFRRVPNWPPVFTVHRLPDGSYIRTKDEPAND